MNLVFFRLIMTLPILSLFALISCQSGSNTMEAANIISPPSPVNSPPDSGSPSAPTGPSDAGFIPNNNCVCSLNVSTLDGTLGFKINGRDASTGFAFQDGAGSSVAGIGDVNGDNFPDLLIGAWRAEIGTGFNSVNSGEAYVILGNTRQNMKNRAAGTNGFDLALLNGTNGLTLEGTGINSQLGATVGGGGDYNGDGVKDFLLGEQNTGGSDSSAYVVYGTTTAFSALNGLLANSLLGNFDLNLDSKDDGAKLVGVLTSATFSTSVVHAGDIDKDGFDDFFISNAGVNINGINSGVVYLVFGAINFDLLNPLNGNNGNNIIAFNGSVANSYFGRSISSIGDINNDNFLDIAIGATADSGTKGKVYVLFGGTRQNLINLAAQINSSGIENILTGANGFILQNPLMTSQLGSSVAGLGDFNGDGTSDFAVGAPSGSEVFIIYGKKTNFSKSLSLSSLVTQPTDGFMISGSWSLGNQIANVGDVNGDGLADILIGNRSGQQAYLIFGTRSLKGLLSSNHFLNDLGLSSAQVLDLSDGSDINAVFPPNLKGAGYKLLSGEALAGAGVRFIGQANGQFGFSVAGLGDLDKDGRNDFIIGDPSATNATSTGSGAAGQVYVIYGQSFTH